MNHHPDFGKRVTRDEHGNIEYTSLCVLARKIQDLASTFHSLDEVEGICPWDAYLIATESIPGVGSGTRHAILFILTVWNPEIPECFDLEPFDIHHALKVWDEDNRSAFLAWAENPWWA